MTPSRGGEQVQCRKKRGSGQRAYLLLTIFWGPVLLLYCLLLLSKPYAASAAAAAAAGGATLRDADLVGSLGRMTVGIDEMGQVIVDKAAEDEEEEEEEDEEEEDEEYEDGDEDYVDEYEEDEEEEDEEGEEYEEDEEYVEEGDEDYEEGEEVEEEEEEEKDPYKHEIYVVDEVVDFEGELRATLILDEITEYFTEDNNEPGGMATWYKISLHLLNSGSLPICGATVEISDTTEVEEVWTLEQIDDSNVYELLWTFALTPDNPRSDSRYFGIVTRGSEVPDVSIESITPCDEDELYDEDDFDDEDEDVVEEGDGEEEEEEEEEEVADDVRLMAGKDASSSSSSSASKSKKPKKVMDFEGDAGDVVLEIDALAEMLHVVVDEVQGLGKGENREVLLNAHITNTAAFPICGISLWIYNFHHASQYWSVTPQLDDKGGMTDKVILPSFNSELEAGQSHFFGFVMDLDVDYPNLAAITANECPPEDEEVAEPLAA